MIYKIEKVIVDDIPFIPVTEGVDWFQYNTRRVQRLADACRSVCPAVAIPGSGHGRGAHAPDPEVSKS